MGTWDLHEEENKVEQNSKVLFVAAVLVAQSERMCNTKGNTDKIKVIID